jgi:YD repeat-containing protein
VAGNLIEVFDSLHPATRYQYDKRDRQTKIIDASGGTTEYSYYADGQTKSVKDAVGNPTMERTPAGKPQDRTFRCAD